MFPKIKSCERFQTFVMKVRNNFKDDAVCANKMQVNEYL